MDAADSGPAHFRELVLRPTSVVAWQDVADVWNHRELLWILALRDVRVRYTQASLGVTWALLQPLVQMAIFTVLFNRFAGIHGDGGVPYPVFCFAGLTVWGLFANGLSHSSESLVNNANLITKVYFPRAIVPLASILTAVVDAAVAFCLLIGLLLVFHVPVHLSMLLCPAIAAVGGLCAAGAGLWLSALNLQFRDVRYALPFFIQMLVYVTPVFYPTSLVPDRYRFLLVLNPMAAVVDNFRQALFGQDLDLGRLGLALAISILLLVTGFIRFRQLERNFADRI